MSGRRLAAALSAFAALAIAAAAILFVMRDTATENGPDEDGGTSPFTGRPDDGGAPVLAVKVDNVAPARPQTGLTRADIVYIQPVEAGLSRILAIFSIPLPDTVGPVRSARESDVELLGQFGEPAFAFSGAHPDLLPTIDDTPIHDVSTAAAPQAYSRDGSRAPPHNLFARPDELLSAAPEASAPRDIGFEFGPSPPGGTAEDRFTVRYRAAQVGFAWSAAEGRWLVSFDGRPAQATEGGRLGADTVVVQYVTIRPSEFRDVQGNVTPYTETVGEGRAVVLRDGASYEARWSRPSPGEGSTFTTAAGEPMTFAPGQTWVVYAPRQ